MKILIGIGVMYVEMWLNPKCNAGTSNTADCSLDLSHDFEVYSMSTITDLIEIFKSAKEGRDMNGKDIS